MSQLDLKPTPLPLVPLQSNRLETLTKDAKLVNGYIEQMADKEIWVYKRPGLAGYAATYTASTPAAGIAYWQGDIYTVYNNTLYKNGTSLGSLTSGGMWQNIQGVTTAVLNGLADVNWSFDSVLGATPSIFLHDASYGYKYDTTNGLVTLTNLPKNLVSGSAYLDGTMYVMDSSGNIKGSNINDLTTWNALNVIVAQIEPDKGVRLAKQLVYVIALKQWSTEFFYDAGNATGSPLGAVQGSKLNFGCAAAGSFQDADGVLFWLAAAKTGERFVVKLENLKPTIISTPAVNRLIKGAYNPSDIITSWKARVSGHVFYGLTFPLGNLSLVFDDTVQAWYVWQDSLGDYIPLTGSAYDATGLSVLQSSADTRLYNFDPTIGTDADATTSVASAVEMDLVTYNYDAGTRFLKYLPRMTLLSDRSESTCLVRVSDDDYKSWSNWRRFDLRNDEPILDDCGSFTRRAFHFRHPYPLPFRIKSVQLSLALGTM